MLFTSPLKPSLPHEMLECQQRQQRALSTSWHAHGNNSVSMGRHGGGVGGLGRSPNTQSFAAGRNRRQSVAPGNKSMRRATTSPVLPPGSDAHAPTPFRSGEMPRGGAAGHAGAARLDSRGSVRGGLTTPQATRTSSSRGGARTGSGFGGANGGGRFPDIGVNTRRTSGAAGSVFDGLTPSILVSPDAAGSRIPKHYFSEHSRSAAVALNGNGGGDYQANRNNSFDDDGRQFTDLPFAVPPAYPMSGSGSGRHHPSHYTTSPMSPASNTQLFQSNRNGGSTSPISPTHGGYHSNEPPRRPFVQSGSGGMSAGPHNFQQHSGGGPPSSAPAALSHRTSPRTSPRETSLVSIRDPNGHDVSGGGRHQHAQLSRDVVASLALPPPGGKPPFVPNSAGGNSSGDYYGMQQQQHRTSGGGTAPGDRLKSPFYTGGGGGNGLLPKMFHSSNRSGGIPSNSLSLSLSSHMPIYGGLKGIATTITTANRIKMATERSRRRRQRHSSLRSEQAQVLGSLQQMLSGLLPMLHLQQPHQASVPPPRPTDERRESITMTPPQGASLIPRPPPVPRAASNGGGSHHGSVDHY
jgi:hypothetical protein